MIRTDKENTQGNTAEEKLLTEIRERWDYCVEQWQDIRAAAKEDMEFVRGDGWPPQERKAREDAGRPCLVFDELSQYINQLINDIRQNKRAVQVNPRGSGANDSTAELRGNMIREIEYKSNAQYAYATAFENSCQRSYGYWRIITRYVNDDSFDQECRIKAIPNPDTVYYDPDCKERDCSDAEYCFVTDTMPRKEFSRRWPKAKKVSFTSDDMKTAPAWIKEQDIQVAEYWRVNHEMGEITQPETGHKRKVDKRTITQIITNGVEILEKNEWVGKYIPIIALFGKELYVDTGAGTRRVLMSFIRLARDPQQLYNYYRTCEAELVGMTPKVPWVGASGQFDSHKEEWQKANQVPLAYLQYDAIVDATGQNVLPPPQRNDFNPPIQSLEVGAESTRRAIQAAMGISALPTQALRMNEKSGTALKQIDQQEDRGSFHFIDNYEMALEHSGRVLNDLLGKIYDSEREVGIRKPDDTHAIVPINQEAVGDDGQPMENDLSKGEHEVTISTGPSFQSEREKANEFVDLIVPNIEQLPLDPVIKARFLALGIKLKNLGPIGDEMVQLLSPDNQTGALQQQLAQAGMTVQQLQQQLALVTAENQKMYQEKVGKMVDNQAMLEKAAMDNMVKLAIAEINTKAQDPNERARLFAETQQQILAQIHEVAMQAADHAHQRYMADMAARQQAIQQAQQPQPQGAVQ